MLVLTRLPQEEVRIGDDICVIVNRVDRQKVSLGFIAPQSIQVHRSEIWQRLRDERADDPTRQTITATMTRQEAFLISDHFRFLAERGNEVAAGIVRRFDRLMAGKLP